MQVKFGNKPCFRSAEAGLITKTNLFYDKRGRRVAFQRSETFQIPKSAFLALVQPGDSGAQKPEYAGIRYSLWVVGDGIVRVKIKGPRVRTRGLSNSSRPAADRDLLILWLSLFILLNRRHGTYCRNEAFDEQPSGFRRQPYPPVTGKD